MSDLEKAIEWADQFTVTSRNGHAAVLVEAARRLLNLTSEEPIDAVAQVFRDAGHLEPFATSYAKEAIKAVLRSVEEGET